MPLVARKCQTERPSRPDPTVHSRSEQCGRVGVFRSCLHNMKMPAATSHVAAQRTIFRLDCALNWSVHAEYRNGRSRKLYEQWDRNMNNGIGKSQKDLNSEIYSLRTADLPALARIWRSISRRSFPDHLPRVLLIGLIAWEMQAQLLGGLSREEEKYLADLARKTGDAPVKRFGETDCPHQLGTVFVREHGGAVHQVTKTSQGYNWQGREFTSLSAVAFAITGTNWNGRRFFGVDKSGRPQRA